MMDFDSLLDQYAELAIRVGLNIHPGQGVFIRATRQAPEFAYRATRAAYRAGADLVHVLWEDDLVELIRVQEASFDSLNRISDWYAHAYNGAAERGDAVLLTHSPDPDLFAGANIQAVAAVKNAGLAAIRPMLGKQARNEFQWTALRVSTPEWAARVYPDDAQSVQKLWDAIFAMCRIGEPDPIGAWHTHIGNLTKRRAALTAKQYHALHFQSPRTDLIVGLPQGHIWCGGDAVSSKGIGFSPNIPTEEVFTLPHRERVDGHVTMTRPLSVNGVLIKEFRLTFEHGRITRVQAPNGQDALENLIATDEGAARLGEVALVPASNPIARRNTIFYDGLYDENAASHIAIGRAYRFTLQEGASMPNAEFIAAGGNESAIHDDTMIGSAEMNVDGVYPDGTREPVMRAGEWAFDV